MGFVRSSLSVVAASAVGFSVFAAAPAAQGADYPPPKPVRCGAKIDGRKIGIKIRPLKNTGYEFKVQKRLKKGKWKVVRTGKTKASTGERVVRVDPGRYRVVCVGGPDRLDGVTSSGRVR